MKKYYLTTPIYYPNQPPHIGGAYTTLAVDVLARYWRSQDRDVFFLTGLDEHGEKIAQCAQKAKLEPQEFCDQMSQKFIQAWRALNISYDYFIRTSDKRHIEGVERFLLSLKESGKVYKAKYKGLYCTGCEKFLTEKELVDGKCPDHNRKPQKVSEENYFFKLKDSLPQIKSLIKDNEITIRPEGRRNEALAMINELTDFSISREKVAWGIPLPWDRSQTCYCWVDALSNYITAIGYGDNQQSFKKYWPADLHLIGKDILKFHVIYWPAMLLAAGLKLPKQIFVHGYFTVNGQKMSKTLGNVIDPNDLITKFGVDATRYLLLSQFPFGKDGDISLEKLTAVYNADLANGLGNLVARVAKFRIKNQELRIKEGGLFEYNQLMRGLQLYEVLQLVQKKIKECDGLVENIRPWEIKDKTKQQKALEPIIKEILFVSQCLAPIMPTISQKIIAIFTTGKSEILFPRI